ncbi:unnamed protein product [Victoria cruziana]
MSTAGREAANLVFQVLRGRWFLIFASCLMMSAAGATYMFGIYSPSIKSALGYDQQTLNTISFFKDLGANVGVISGLIAEVTPPWFVLFLGATLNFGGYFMIWLAVTKRIAQPKLWQMCLYICIGANSQTFANTGSLVTCVRSFPESRGIVLGLLKGFTGLSGAIFTQLYYAIYGQNPEGLILLIAWLPSLISYVFLPFVRVMKGETQKREMKAFYSILYITVALAGFLMVVIIIQPRVHFTAAGYKTSAAVVVTLLLLPLVVIFREELPRLKKSSIPSYIPNEDKEAEKLQSTTQQQAPAASTAPPPPSPVANSSTPATNGAVACLKKMFKAPDRGEDYTILQALVSIDMLILFFATICGLGGTLTAIDNLGQIGQSLGYPKQSIGTFVSLISIWNYAGRVLAGFVSEIFLAKYRLPRPLMLSFVLLFSCVGHLLIAFGVPGSLYFASIILGLCFGAQWPLLFAIISELFGLKYYSTLFNFAAVASPIGSYILNVRVAGSLYDQEGLKQAGGVRPQGELTCIGSHCYRLSFIIIAGATFLGFLVSLILVMRTRKFYKGDIYAKFRQPNNMEMSGATGPDVPAGEVAFGHDVGNGLPDSHKG